MLQDTISVVVPIFEESGNLRELVRAIRTALASVRDIRYEVILVDDGSKDDTWALLEELHAGDARIKGLRFTRNFGHQAALTAGYRYATGDAVITMDGDLQHPPELLPQMIARWRSGFDIVSMVRLSGRSEGFLKGLTSRLFYRLMNQLTEVPIRPGVADFRLLDRRVVKQLNSLKERARFVRGLISWTGFRESEIHYRPAPRFAGSTKYSLQKMVRLALHAVSSFSSVPLRLSFHAGFLAILACPVLMSYAFYNRVYEGKDLSEWASTFITMLFLGGIQLLMIGVMGVYVGRIFGEIKKRPVFIADEELGIARPARRRVVKRVAAAAGAGR